MHTKGEWKFNRPNIESNGIKICTLIEPHYMPDCGDVTWYNGCVKTMEANAHLIAAAPDLYKALKQIVDWMEEWDGAEWNFNGLLTNGRKAIAKVERK